MEQFWLSFLALTGGLGLALFPEAILPLSFPQWIARRRYRPAAQFRPAQPIASTAALAAGPQDIVDFYPRSFLSDTPKRAVLIDRLEALLKARYGEVAVLTDTKDESASWHVHPNGTGEMPDWIVAMEFLRPPHGAGAFDAIALPELVDDDSFEQVALSLKAGFGVKSLTCDELERAEDLEPEASLFHLGNEVALLRRETLGASPDRRAFQTALDAWCDEVARINHMLEPAQREERLFEQRIHPRITPPSALSDAGTIEAMRAPEALEATRI